MKNKIETAISNLINQSDELEMISSLVLIQSLEYPCPREILFNLLTHPNKEIQRLTISILKPNLTKNEIIQGLSTVNIKEIVLDNISVDDEVMAFVVPLLMDNTRISQKAMECITRSTPIINVNLIKTELYKILILNDNEFTTRVYETIVKMVSLPNQYDRLSELLDFIQFNPNDTLGFLNLLEILPKTVDFYRKTRILDQINSFKECKELMGGISIFYSLLMYNCAELYYFDVNVIEYLDSIYDSVKDQVIISIGNIGSNPVTLPLLFNSNLLKKYLEDIKYATTLKVLYLTTLECILSTSEQTEGIYKSWNNNPTEYLLLNSDSDELSIVCLRCLRSILNYEWGVKTIINSPSYNLLKEKNFNPAINQLKREIMQKLQAK
jgi:hypothetical protein